MLINYEVIFVGKYIVLKYNPGYFVDNKYLNWQNIKCLAGSNVIKDLK